MASAPEAAPSESNSTSADTESPPSPPSSSPPPPHHSSPPPTPSPPPPSPPPPEKEDKPPPEADNKKSPPPEDNQGSHGDKNNKDHKDKSNPSPPPPAKQEPGNVHHTPSGALPEGDNSSSEDDGGSHKSPPKKQGNSSGDNQAVIVGAAVGVVLFLVLILISALVCYISRRRNKNRKASFHGSQGGGQPNGGGYYNNNGSGPPKWQGQGGEHNIRIPPPGGWNGPPAPLSCEMTTPTYSGPHGPVLPPPSPGLAMGFNKSTFTYEELASATSGFAQSNMIGQGGFGYVYKGTLPDGKEVAIKQLKAGSGQGEREFQAEVEIISRVHHKHLVSLVGYCIAGVQRLLVYEFVPNKTLEYHLHGKGVPVMEWPTRVKIAIGSAKGLAYLHEDCHPRIIHRDIKTANILLDYKYEALVADFGLAKPSTDNNTHVSTRVMGTFGYLAPEYASTGKLTDRSDVFSYGVMLLELITGRRPIDHSGRNEDSLVDWARPMLAQVLADENYDDVADPRLDGNYTTAEMARMIACAAACVRHSAKRRPRMSQIARALEGDMISFDDVGDGVKPGQSSQFSSSSEQEGGTYSSKMRQFQKVAMASGDHTSDSSGSSSEEMLYLAGRKPR